MPDFRLRIWQEQVLYDCNTYIVKADTLDDAVELLREKQDQADDQAGMCLAPVTHEAICRFEHYRGKQVMLDDGIRPLDPEEVVGGDSGVCLIDERGWPVRDLVGVPTGCEQAGTPLGCDEAVPDTGNRVATALKALVDWGREHTSPLSENSPHDLLIEAIGALKAAGIEA